MVATENYSVKSAGYKVLQWTNIVVGALYLFLGEKNFLDYFTSTNSAGLFFGTVYSILGLQLLYIGIVLYNYTLKILKLALYSSFLLIIVTILGIIFLVVSSISLRSSNPDDYGALIYFFVFVLPLLGTILTPLFINIINIIFLKRKLDSKA